MADMPYSLAYARLPEIFARIKTAGTPPKFHNEFLKSTLGFTSSNDRAVISILRKLGFIDSNGQPTQRYNDYKGHEGGRAVAKGLREGWPGLFMADQRIYTKNTEEISKRVVTLTGANEKMSNRIASTFVKLCEIADWTPEAQPEQSSVNDTPEAEGKGDDLPPQSPATVLSPQSALNLHHDIHIHLPTTSDAAVYRAVFQAIKSELL